MSEIFISYARATAETARAVAAELRAHGWTVWFDDDLPSHRAYAEVIEERLAAAKAVVVIWSPDAVRSQWVRSEADRARQDGKLVQLRLGGVQLPMPFDQIQCLELAWGARGADEREWARVVAAISTLTGDPVAAAAAPARAASPTRPSAASGETVIAVLPFDTPANDAEMAGVGDGVAEDVIGRLANVAGARVIGRTTSFRFRGALKAGAAESLGASHVLDGAVRRSGGRIRVTVHLTEVANGSALWAERYDRLTDDLFAVQDELSALVAEAVTQRLAPSAGGSEPVAEAPVVQSERRQVTVLACEIASGRGGGQPIDPEQWQETLARLRPIAAREVERMGGYLAEGRSDALLAYFGYPQAWEDASERAVRTALAMTEAVARVRREVGLTEGALSCAIGIDAGTVVIAPGDGGGFQVFGDVLATAIRARDVAEPGCVAVTDVVRELTDRVFEVQPSSSTSADGGGPFFQIRGAAPLRRQDARTTYETPFVGRDEEMRLLRGRWEQSRMGEGQAVLLSGEAGIGKSRLLATFRESLGVEPHTWLECAGAPIFGTTPFHTAVQILGFDRASEGEPPEARMRRLEAELVDIGARAREAAQLIGELLGLPLPDSYPPLALAPDQARQRLLSALSAWVFAAARRRPTILVVEDLQWVDPSSLELINLLLEQGAMASLLLIRTARPDAQIVSALRGHHAQLTLGRLTDRQTRELVTRMKGASVLAPDAIEGIVQRTDGVPLFAEELTDLVVESGGRLTGREVPMTLLDSLAARLSRLGPAKEVAQIGAVLGREFPYSLLRRVSGLSEPVLDVHLRALADAELFYVRGLPPETSYRFKHALMQDAAYESLLRTRRRELHRVAATVLAEPASPSDEAPPEILARHWSEAGEAALAIAAWKRAGEAANARRAFREAEHAFREALAHVDGLPEGAKKDEEALSLISALNRVLQITLGYAAPETRETAARARELAEKAGSLSQVIREEAALWRAVITTGDYTGAAALADHILELSGRDDSHAGRVVFALNAQVQTRFYTGDLAGVEEHFETLSPLLDQPGLRQAPGNNVVAIGVAALAAWMLGRRDTAHARMARARTFAETTGDPYDMAMVLHFARGLATSEADLKALGDLAGKLLALADENGFSYVRDLALPPYGLAKVRAGQVAEGAAAVEEGIKGLLRAGARVAISNYQAMLAEAQAAGGDVETAIATLEEALVANPQERVFLPDILRRLGEMKISIGRTEEGRDSLREAVAAARRTGAIGMELRASITLARALEPAARDLDGLRSLLGRFAEPPTPDDLAAAQALLDA